MEEVNAITNASELKREKKKAETNVIAITEGKIRRDAETCFNYETKLPANGLFNYKKDKNIMDTLLKRKKEQNELILPRCHNTLTKAVIEKDEMEHELYVEKFKRKFLRAKKNLELEMIK